jgi:hypothetical protein
MNWRLIVVLFVIFVSAFLLAGIAIAEEGDPEVPVITFSKDGVELCFITATLKVRGDNREKCVETLSTAARLAAAEARVNTMMKRKKR